MTSTDLFRKVEIIVEEKEDDGSEGEEECLPSRTWTAPKKREEGVREKETDQQQQQQQQQYEQPESDVDDDDVIVAVERPAAFSMSPPLPTLHRSTTTTLDEMPIKSSSSRETEEVQVGGGYRHSEWYVRSLYFDQSDTNNELSGQHLKKQHRLKCMARAHFNNSNFLETFKINNLSTSI